MESGDGRWYCVMRGSEPPNPQEAPPAGDAPSLMGAGSSGPLVTYEFSTFPREVTIHNEHGVELPSARGQVGDFLIVIDPTVGLDPAPPTTRGSST